MKHKFIMLDGKVIETERFVQGPVHSKGNHWRQHEPGVWVETFGEIETIDPNKRTLFGYDENEFMARQYK